MDDTEIIALYNARVETAISKTHSKYGRMLHRIALNILSNHEDSEEIVSDTYGKAWDTIPPQQPSALGAYLGRITRNLSINRWHSLRAKKRFSGADVLLSELGDWISSPDTVETEIEAAELVRAIDRWLGALPTDDRILFLRRYWFGDEVKELAKESETAPNKLTSRLYRLRQSLKKTLEQEGIFL